MAENLWALREQKKLSVAILASRAGLPIGLIMEYEAGQKSIDPRHLTRIARVLYVEESDLRLRSEPRPVAGAAAQPPQPEGRPASADERPAPKPRDGQARPPRPAPLPKPVVPARPSQIAHLQDLLLRLGHSQAEVEAELGRPLDELDRQTARSLLVRLQAEYREGRVAERHRAYLPEAVDQFELKYLAEVQAAGAVLHFVLFDNTTVAGQVIGFGPYNITVRTDDGAEITLNKLALVRYHRERAA